MAHHIFLVHGMGNFEDGWSKAGEPSVQDGIRALFQQYTGTADLVGDFEIHELNYNQVFEAWRKRWAELAKDAAAAAQALKITTGFAKNLIKLADAATGDNFLRTHILDVALYRFARPVTEEVMTLVQDQIGRVFEEPAKKGEPIEYTVIAHSLGTLVAYEAFHAMMTDSSPLPPSARPNNVFMVANVVAALWQRGPNIYVPAMAPNLKLSEGWCFRLTNVGHRLDPVARLRPFDPPDAWFQPGKKDKTYLDVWLQEDDVLSENIHSLTHYLSHPRVHVPLLRQLTHPSLISDEEEEEAIAEWEQLGDDVVKQKVQDALGGLLLKLDPDLMNQLALWKSLRELLLKSNDPNPDGERQS
ncbi:hypothetical protein HLB44_27245 [Aquincola sp. S2]|uniref:Alpha/beta hydrolase n=1 Tax=Pseudaquabacterium terrae TaxID=2732868 RepID=A0ABX2EPY1_9BURK|nr:hypothetical protein [Aquabacterium terrae]NRF70707.1 hypothetical protein [Aquabacterium terrae]